MLRVNLTGK